MNLFGLSITKAAPQQLSSVDSRGGWWPVIREAIPGAFQRNIEWRAADVLTYAAVYACVTLIASDIGKLRIKLVRQDATGIWTETDNPAFSPVLRKPNRYQTRIKFFEQWLTSKLIHGNTFVLKQRDGRGVVEALYVLDPQRVKPLVSSDGAVYYSLQRDDLSNVDEDQFIVPASEIIHDVMVALYHPLCGISPLTACGLAAMQGLRIQNNSATFFGNASQPSGILTAPHHIKDEIALKLKDRWEAGFTGANAGRVAVLGDGLKYEMVSVNAVDAQLIEQLRWTADNVCTALHVPNYMVGVGPPPTYNNIEALAAQYYAQCLQTHIESLELLLDEGLGMVKLGERQTYGTEFDLNDLLRMDTATRVKAAGDAVGAAVFTIDEARREYFGLGPVKGGDTPYLQQQYWPLAQLSDRTIPEIPAKPIQQALPPGDEDVVEGEVLEPDDVEREIETLLRKELELTAA